jgi:hypothetical protein
VSELEIRISNEHWTVASRKGKRSFCGTQRFLEGGGGGVTVLATATRLAGRPCNEAVEMIDHEKAQGKPAQRAELLEGVLRDATWQPMFLFYMG